MGGHRLYPEQALTVLRVIKAAQRLGFTLDEVADLLAVTRFGRRRTGAGLQARAAVKPAEVDAKLAELTAVRDTLRAVIAAGCDDLITCSESPCCNASQGRACGVLPARVSTTFRAVALAEPGFWPVTRLPSTTV
ncbi:MerR family DNA-binding protein [Nocardia beijingensis]|uniref:MerR family DNA-binding protein n=1 Tax=Nocardia beijingensis TaxID=95162 RepID=UPI0033293343